VSGSFERLDRVDMVVPMTRSPPMPMAVEAEIAQFEHHSVGQRADLTPGDRARAGDVGRRDADQGLARVMMPGQLGPKMSFDP
jgi:hypothetical protein